MAQKQINQYSNLLSLKQREIAEKAIAIQTQHPGSFSQNEMSEHYETLARTKDIKFDNIRMELCLLVNETVSINHNVYKPLLKTKNDVFESINVDVQKRADEILRIGRK